MRIFNEDKTEVLESYDLQKGYLKDDTIVTHVPAVCGVEERGHYETVKEYANGGKDVRWVVDVPCVNAVEAHDEVEPIKVYVPYTETELQRRAAVARIAELKQLLRESDYKAIKYAEGLLDEREYIPIRAERKAWRKEINELEESLREG